MPGTWTRWAVVAAATAAVAVGFGAIGLPSAALFAALLVGIAYALTLAPSRPVAVSTAGMTAAQAVVGVALGTAVDADTLKAVGSDWAPVALVTIATLAASLAAGLTMARITKVDRPTASLGLIAGGATGIVAMADELGADGRLVAVMQYLRVLVVVLIAPPLAHIVAGGGAGVGAAGAAGDGLPLDLLFTLGCVVGGLAIARAIRLTAGALLVPLAVAAALSIGGVAGDARVPDLVEQAAFAVIGLRVGLRFTVATLRETGRLLVPTLVSVLALIAICAGLAALLVPLADVSYADAYLATTPGGLYAVLAAAADMGGNTTFVVAVQALRVLVMVLAAPPLVRLLMRGSVRPPAPR